MSNLKKLKTGITTGSCAAAAAKASAIMLLTDQKIDIVIIKAKYTNLQIDIEKSIKTKNFVSCTVKKYSGDDPDVTNGIDIVAKVSKIECGLTIEGGEGVGLVTKKGLKVDIGKSAINPVPMQMITDEINSVIKKYNYNGGFKVVISVPNGQEVAKKTLNERLGIVDGISILGTTGVVNPMSEKALIDSIKLEIDVNIANNVFPIVITPGNYGYEYAKDILGIDVKNAIKCSNYIGETLDYALLKGINRIIFIGHAGKLVKIAGGIMNTHSNIGDCRMEIIASHCAMFGMDKINIRKIMECVTINGAIEIIKECNLENEVWDSIGKKIKFYLDKRVNSKINIEFYVFTQEYGVLTKG